MLRFKSLDEPDIFTGMHSAVYCFCNQINQVRTMLRQTLLATALCFATVNAYSESWHLYELDGIEGGMGSAGFVDKDSLSCDGNGICSIWEKTFVYPVEPRTVGNVTGTLYSINCNAWQFREAATVSYQYQNLVGKAAELATSFEGIQPRSRIDEIAKLACKKIPFSKYKGGFELDYPQMKKFEDELIRFYKLPTP